MVVKNRKKRVKTKVSSFLSNLACELLSLWAIDEMPLPAVLGKLLVAIRRIDERGLQYCRTYFRAEKDQIEEVEKLPAPLNVGRYFCRHHSKIHEDLKEAFPSMPFSDILPSHLKKARQRSTSPRPSADRWRRTDGQGERQSWRPSRPND